jgi:hypothetical protein
VCKHLLDKLNCFVKDIPHTNRQIQEIENLRMLVGQLASNEDDFIPFRHKRGVFNY